MRQKISKNILFSFIALVVLAGIALIYNMPVISGNKALLQPDIVNYKGSAEEMLTYQKQTGENIYWSDAMFGGMPTYQTGAKYDYNFIKKIDEVFRFLPRPADYIFILFGGFFILGIVLFRNWKYALLGSLLFGLGTYFFIIIEAGHNAKVHAIAYFAPLAAGIILLYKRKYILGFILTTLFMALELVANHPQMTYYFGFVMALYVLFELIDAVKKKELKPFAISSLLSLGAIVLALGLNSTNYFATYEYSKESTRGKNTVTVLKNEHSNHSGLNKDYITAWSYGKLETLNLFIPNFMGGGSTGTDEYKKNLEKAIPEIAGGMASQYVAQDNRLNYQEVYSQIANSLANNIQSIPTYWGEQPFTSGPAYQGSVVILLFILGLFLVRGKYKWWLLSATLLSMLLAWGKNLMWFTDLFIDYVPFYDKFRAVSSVLVMAEFTMPLLAVLAVCRFFADKSLTQEFKQKILYYVGGGVVAFLLILWLMGGSLFSFESVVDSQLPETMAKAIKSDRIAMFKTDTLRTLFFVVLTLVLLIVYNLKVLKRKEIVIGGICLLTLVDLWSVDKRYLNDENFIPKQWVQNPFPTEMGDRMMQAAQQNPNIMQIAYRIPTNKLLSELKKDDPSHYRVFNQAVNTFNDASTSYFVNSVGGYHGAKLQNIQNIIDVYFSGDSIQNQKLGLNGNEYQNILGMLNTKYFVVGNVQEPKKLQNPNVAGNAWFVKKLITAKDDNDAILKIGKIDFKNQAVVENADKFKTNNSNGNIQLKSYQPNKLVYQSNNSENGFAVFSEIFYDKGWVAKIDGKESPIIKTNYFLRGLEIPKGTHEIIFSFEPQSVKIGNKVTLASNILFVLIILGSGLLLWRKKRLNF